MKRAGNIIISLLLTICMLLTYVPVVSNADSGSDIYYKRAMSSYNSFLERMENGGNDGEWNFKVEEFALQDLNNDGIPELITHGGGRTDYAKIYSCQEGFFQSVHYGSSLNYYTNGIVEVSFSSGNGYWSDSFYKLNNDLYMDYVYAYTEWLTDYPETYSEGEYSYEEDSERVDYSLIQQHKAEVLQGATAVQLNYYANTEANRSKVFGSYLTETKEYREDLGMSGYNYIQVKDRSEDGFLAYISFPRRTSTDGFVYAWYTGENEAAFYDDLTDISGTLTFEGNKLVLDLEEIEDFYSNYDLSEFVGGLHHEYIYGDDEERSIVLGDYATEFGPHELTIDSTMGVFNKNMAMLCGILNEAAYSDNGNELINVYYQMGAPTMAKLYNYDKGGFCYGFGYVPMVIDYKEYNVIVVTVRGTNGNFKELCADMSDRANRDSWGYTSYNEIYDFEAEIINNLTTYLSSNNLDEKPFKLIITGHSLGGAAANLLAARFTKFANSGAWWSPLVSKKDIYAYTFGAIDAIKTKQPVSEGFENIHNVYNMLDTYGPNGNKLITAAGNSIYGKFGHMDLFERDHRPMFEQILYRVTNVISDLVAIKNSAGINHCMTSYLDSVATGYATETRNALTRVRIKCPVDVNVYEENKLVGRIHDNVVDEELTSIDMIVNEDAKYVVFPSDKKYTFKISATDEGKMDISVETMTGKTVTANTFNNVQLTKGKELLSKVNGSNPVKLYVVDNDGKVIAEVQADGTETVPSAPEQNNGSAVSTPAAGPSEIIDLPAVKISKPKAAKKSATIKWKKVSKKNLKKIKKVEIQYSMDKSFQTGVKTKYIKAKKTSLKIKKLKSKKKYYVRLRAYTAAGGAVHVSKWSRVKTVKAR